MASSKMNLPPGFQLEEEQSTGLPPGFVLEEENKKKADWGTAAKTHFANLGNIFDMAGTLAWSVPATTERKDEMYKNLEERKKQRDRWANPEGSELSFLQKAAGVPAGLISMPLQPVETAKTFLDQGESGTRAAIAGGVDAIGTIAGLALPVPGTKAFTRAAGNAAVNAAQDYITRKIIETTAEKESTKKIFEPTLETTALAGLTGGVWGAATTKRQPKVDKTPLPDVSPIEAAVKETKQNIPFAEKTNESQQYELFDQPEMGRVANPYEAKLGDWRVDENGIPIKADLSMELQNLQEPLQRNLWGDELPQTRNPIGQSADLFDAERQMFDEGMQEGIPLTQAIDSMPWAQRRGAIKRELTGEVLASGELQGAIAEANSPFTGMSKNQRGAVDVDAAWKSVSENYDKLVKLLSKTTIHHRDFFETFNEDMDMYMSTGDPSVLNYLRQEVKALGYGPEVDAAFKELISTAEKYKSAQELQSLPFEVKQKYNQARIGFAEMQRQMAELEAEFNKLPDQYTGASRKDQYAMRTLNKKMYAIQDELMKLVGHDIDLLKRDDLTANQIQYLVQDLNESGIDFTPYLNKTQTEKSTNVVQGKFGQRGAIDLQNVQDGVRRLLTGEENSRGLLERFRGTFYGDEIKQALTETLDPKSRERVVWLSPDEFHRHALTRDGTSSIQREGRQQTVREAIHGKDGLSTMPQLFVNKGVVWGHEGRHRMDIFKELGVDLVPVRLRDSHIRNEDGALASKYESLLSQNGEVLPVPKEFNDYTSSSQRIARQSERGVLSKKDIENGIANLRKRFGGVEDSINTPISEQTIQAKQTKVTKTKAVSNILGTKLPEWTDPATFEETVSLAREAKDIKSNPYLRGTAPGNNFMATYHNNPVLKYMRKILNDARGEATKFSKTYLTSQDGLSTLITQLDKADQVRVAELITQMDKHQVDYTPELGAKISLSPTADKFMQQLKIVSDANWDWGQKVRGEQGIKSAPKRKGYAASLWNGEYQSLVLDKDGEVIGFIAVPTPGEFDLAIKHYKANNPGAKFSAETWQKARSAFTSNNKRALRNSDLTSMIKLLANADGDFAKLQQKVQLDTVRAAHELFRHDVHTMQKKGITGNLGNKPWLSPEKNARQRLDSIVRFFEESAEYLSLQKPMEELNLLAADESTAHMPNTKDYINDYMKNVEGRYVHSFGNVMNNLFNMSSHAATEIADKIPGARNYIGPGNILRASNYVKNKMSQMYMGVGNWMFTVAQLAQPVQNGVPMLSMIATKVGLPQDVVVSSMSKATGDYIKLGLNNEFDKMSKGKFRFKVGEDTAKILEYGRMRGILDFSELERAYEGHKTKVGRAVDNVAEFNMRLGEEVTRPPMFLAVVDMLRKTGASLDKVLPMAENITNQIMADYHQWERPLMYNGLGVLAPHAGGLTTFKHNFMGNQALFAQAAKEGDYAPMLLSTTNMLMLAGLTGIPFYGELNTVYEELRDLLGLDHKSIAQTFMKDFPQWVKTGVVSSLLELNMQGKFSAADMVPDSPWKALFPHLSGAADIGVSAVEAAKNPNENTLGNLAVAATPSGWKQATRAAVKRDEEGNLLSKRGEVDVPRTTKEWVKSSVTGLYHLDEAVKREELYQNRENERVRKDTLIDISTKFRDAVINNASPQELADIVNKYEEFGGIGATLIEQIPKIKIEAGKTSKERAEGIPKSPQGVKRYDAYQN